MVLQHSVDMTPTAMQLGNNDHTHARAHLPFLHEYALQNKHLAHAAATLSSMAYPLSSEMEARQEASLASIVAVIAC